MSIDLSESQQAELKQLLDSPLLQKAIEHAFAESWKSKANAETVESSALANAFREGSADLVDRLYGIVKAKRTITPNTSKLRHTAHKP